MTRVRFCNESKETLVLNIEPHPDRYSIRAGEKVEVLNLTPAADGSLEVSVHGTAEGYTISFESLDDHAVLRNGVVLEAENI